MESGRRGSSGSGSGSGETSNSSSTTSSGDNMKDRKTSGDASALPSKDGSMYRGPFSSKWAVSEVQKLLQNYKDKMQDSKTGNFI